MAGELDKKAWELCSEGSYLVAGEERLSELQSAFPEAPDSTEAVARFHRLWSEFLKETRVELGTLLKTDNLAILLGAGASLEAGGPLLGHIPEAIERELLAAGVDDGEVKQWLAVFYGAVSALLGTTEGVPSNKEEVLARRDASHSDLQVNYERLIEQLHVWERAFPNDASELQLASNPFPAFKLPAVRECRQRLVSTLVRACDLRPSETDLESHTQLVKKLVTRPLTLKRSGIFSLNYDLLVENATDAEGVVLLDGFVGTTSRIFRPESYDHDLYFPAETTEGRVHRLDRVLHLYKLHGSVSWLDVEPSWDNPYGITATGKAEDEESVVIYPSPAKYAEALAMPYAELFRRFANNVVRPQATLIGIGYGFGDEHVNAIIRQALAIPSVNLVIVDPSPKSDFVKTLQQRGDRRVRIFSGTLGTFRSFVANVLPDLSEEEVERRVVETYNALQPNRPPEPTSPSTEPNQ